MIGGKLLQELVSAFVNYYSVVQQIPLKIETFYLPEKLLNTEGKQLKLAQEVSETDQIP